MCFTHRNQQVLLKELCFSSLRCRLKTPNSKSFPASKSRKVGRLGDENIVMESGETKSDGDGAV